MAATSALQRTAAHFAISRSASRLGTKLIRSRYAVRPFCVDAAKVSQATSATAAAQEAPSFWRLKNDAVLQPLTSPESLEGHEKGLLLERDDVFCRRMGRTWEVVANAVWTPGSKAEQILEEACGQQLCDRLIALRKAKTGYKSTMKVTSSKLVDYLEFVNVSEGKGSVGMLPQENSLTTHTS